MSPLCRGGRGAGEWVGWCEGGGVQGEGRGTHAPVPQLPPLPPPPPPIHRGALEHQPLLALSFQWQHLAQLRTKDGWVGGWAGG